MMTEKKAHCCCQVCCQVVHTAAPMKNINQIFPSLSVIMEWVLHPNVMAMAMKKMGIMATGGDVQTVMAMENKKD